MYLSISWISPEGLFPSSIQPAQAKAYEKTIALLQTAPILIIALFFLRVEMRQELQYIDSFDKKNPGLSLLTSWSYSFELKGLFSFFSEVKVSVHMTVGPVGHQK